MRRHFARNLLFVIGINLLVKPVWIFLIDRTVQNRVGHASYGTFQALLNMSVIMQFVLDFGLNNYNTRAISRSPESFAERFPVMLGLRLMLMGLYTAVVLLIGFAIGYRGAELGLLSGTILIQTLTMLLLFIRSNVAGFQRFKLDGVLSILDRLLMIFVCGGLLFLPAIRSDFKIEWFIWAQVGCYAIAIFVGFFMLWKITHVPIRLSFHFNKVWGLLKDAAPYALLIFLMSIYMRIDTTLLERLSSKEEAGIYASAYRQLDVCNMFAILFAGILLPMLGRMLAEHKKVSSIIRLSANLLIPLAFTGVIISWFCGEGIMHLLYPAAGTYDGKVFAWVMSCLPAYSLMYIYSTLLTANGSLRLLNLLAMCASILNIGLNFLIIPRFGALGAAIVAGITQWSIALSSVYFATRRNDLFIRPKWISAHILYGILLCCFGLLANYWWNAAWVPVFVSLIAASVILIPVFRFIDLKQFRLFLQSRE